MYKVFLIFLFANYVESQIESYVVGGEYTNINKYPHAVYLDMISDENCICGGSILNQDIVLSAAHCFDDYKSKAKDHVIIYYGASDVKSMLKTIMRQYILHKHYNVDSMTADVALIRCKTKIKLGNLAKRVAIMKNPPNDNMAYVSGWGAVNKQAELPSILKHTTQQIQKRETCKKYVDLPTGTFCAGPITGKGYPYLGDSGGPLMIQQYIQIGIVSFIQDGSLVAYTNISYYFDWITNNAAKMYCAKR